MSKQGLKVPIAGLDHGTGIEAVCRKSRERGFAQIVEYGVTMLAGLVQVFRFCGLLPESIRAHERAVNMDCAVVTSVAHTLFLAGEFASAIEHYGGRGAFYLDAAAWAVLGERERAVTLLRSRLNKSTLSPQMSALLSSLLALLEGKNDDAVRLMDSADRPCDPEVLFLQRPARSSDGTGGCSGTCYAKSDRYGISLLTRNFEL